MADRLSLSRKLGFTVGDYACNLYWQGVSIFLLFFYTDAVGLSAATAGFIYMIASVVDSFCDPVMGTIAERTRTRRGRYRPYILFGAAPLGLAYVFLYWKPPLSGLVLAAWMLGSHVVFRLAYTVLSIPYTTLNARLTDSSTERSTIAGFRMIFAVLAGLTISFFTLRLAGIVGLERPAGFTLAAAVFAGLATLIFPMVYVSTREPAETPAEVIPPSIGRCWRAVRHNRAFWVLVLSFSAGSVCSVALGKSVLYYFKYYLKDEAGAQLALTAMAATGIAAIPAWVWVTAKVGKRTAWYIASGVGLVLMAIFAVFDIRSSLVMTGWLVAITFNSLGLAFEFWAMLPDTVEYGELKGKVRSESIIFGLGQFFLKAGLGIGAGLFGWLLSLAGYKANIVQSPETLAHLKLLMVALPTLGLLIAGAGMIFYPMGKGDHEKIVETLAAGSKEASEPSFVR
ncbi:MAG: MFS transporter [Caulobacteraceae bacterium]